MRLAVVLALAGGINAPALAAAGGPDAWHVQGIAPGQGLVVRARPSTKAPVVGAIPAEGRDLVNLGCNVPSFEQWLAMSPQQQNAAAAGRWCKVRYRNVTGWVRGRYLREAD